LPNLVISVSLTLSLSLSADHADTLFLQLLNYQEATECAACGSRRADGGNNGELAAGVADDVLEEATVVASGVEALLPFASLRCL